MARLDYAGLAPEAVQTLRDLERAVRQSGLEPLLLELVKVRVSMINGCAFCLDMHTQDARALGESEQRLYGLAAWGEAPFYTERERAGLAWAEAVTLLGDTDPVDDTLYHHVRLHFTDRELVWLTWAVVAINSWNRLSISMRVPAGTYRPQPRSGTDGAQGVRRDER